MRVSGRFRDGIRHSTPHLERAILGFCWASDERTSPPKIPDLDHFGVAPPLYPQGRKSGLHPQAGRHRIGRKARSHAAQARDRALTALRTSSLASVKTSGLHPKNADFSVDNS